MNRTAAIHKEISVAYFFASRDAAHYLMDWSLQEARPQQQPADQNDEPAVNLRPLEIIGDVSNAVKFLTFPFPAECTYQGTVLNLSSPQVLEYCAQGLDAMEE